MDQAHRGHPSLSSRGGPPATEAQVPRRLAGRLLTVESISQHGSQSKSRRARTGGPFESPRARVPRPSVIPRRDSYGVLVHIGKQQPTEAVPGSYTHAKEDVPR